MKKPVTTAAGRATGRGAARAARPATRPATKPATKPAAKSGAKVAARAGGRPVPAPGRHAAASSAPPPAVPSAARSEPKHDARASRAGIGALIAGVSLTPSRPARPAGQTAPDAGRPGAGRPGADTPGAAADAGATVGAPGGAPAVPAPDPRAAARHPVGSGIAFERVEDVYRMDPSRIILDGPYVRQFVEDADFQRLVAAVALERDIGQHVGVRIVGPPTEARRVLVYGMRRWRAALQVGLDRVPVRDYGRISEDKAVELQMLENEIRADPHPVDTALGFYLLSQQAEWSQKRIAEVFDKNKGYVSEMVRAGEAIARLRESDRRPLYTAPRVTVRAFQNLAVIKSVEARREALLALVDAAPAGAGDPTGSAATGSPAAEPGSAEPSAPGAADAHGTATDRGDAPAANGRDEGVTRPARPRLVDESVFSARVIRNGRAFRVRWTDDDLRRDAHRIAEEFRARFLDEYQLLLHRAAVLQGQAPARSGAVPADIAAMVASAAQDAARVDARIGAAGPAGGERRP